MGGFRVDGTRFAGVIEQNASLLALTDKESYSREILERSAKHSLENDRVTEAIKLYNLAGDYSTVVSCLAVALGQAIAAEQGGARDGKTHELERTASDILRHYERTGRAVGREREAVVRLLKIREAVQAKERGKWDLALDLMESTGLIPLSGDITKITRQAEEFRELHESLQRNLQTYLVLTMDALAGICQRTKSAGVADATRQLVSYPVRSCDGNGFLTWVFADSQHHPEEVAFPHDFRGHPQVPHEPRYLLLPRQVGRRDCVVISFVCYVVAGPLLFSATSTISILAPV